MGRLIDADELLSVVRHMTVVDKSVMHRMLIQMPTVDAIEVVRCRDCKHNPKLEWFGCPMAGLSAKQRPETAWCWKGERNDGGDGSTD